jgi:short subunit dehydrogenase-like uncharacterized protein
MSRTSTWMLYGAAGHTGTLIAHQAHARGHRPLLAGRTAPAVGALAEQLDLPFRTVALDEPDALRAALANVELVLNAAGPFLHTAAPLAEACLNSGVDYLDISNELQAFRTLYGLDERARRARIAIVPGVGFGVVATNCLARYVNDAVGGADRLEVAARITSAQPGPGAAATMRANLPYGGWIRRGGQLEAQQLGAGVITIVFPDGSCNAMPVPTGDLEAAFHATGAPNIVAYSATADPAALNSQPSAPGASGTHTVPSYGWARATSSDGDTAEAFLQTGDSYLFTAAASIRAVEESLGGTVRGALSPAEAFGADFALTIPDADRIDKVPPPRESTGRAAHAFVGGGHDRNPGV